MHGERDVCDVIVVECLADNEPRIVWGTVPVHVVLIWLAILIVRPMLISVVDFIDVDGYDLRCDRDWFFDFFTL